PPKRAPRFSLPASLALVDLDVASLQNLVAGVVAVGYEDPVLVGALTGLGVVLDVEAVEERAPAVDGRAAVDRRLGGAYAHDDQHVALQVHRIRRAVILVLLVAGDVPCGVHHGVPAEAGLVTVVGDDPPAVGDLHLAA